jgi:two-component system response regulator MprA
LAIAVFEISFGVAATQVTHVTTTGTPQQTILVVDDERFIVSLLTEILEEEGYLVRIASDGEAALRIIESIRPDLVVADIMMPRLDGLTLAATLRSWSQPIPVILMSAAVTPRSHGVAFIPKPFDIDDLLDAVDAVLSAPPGRHG